MAHTVPTYIILLRAIGPVTHKLMSMQDWRQASEAAGFDMPETHINTGNMVAGFAGTEPAARKAMTGVLRGFGLGENVVPVVRRPGFVRRFMNDPTVREAAAVAAPEETGCYFFVNQRPDLEWVDDYDGRERLVTYKNHLFVDFRGPPAKSGRLIRHIGKQCGTSTARSYASLEGFMNRFAARVGRN